MLELLVVAACARGLEGHVVKLDHLNYSTRWEQSTQGNYVPLSTEKPHSVTKEPDYMGTPLYGYFYMGVDPDLKYLVVVDETPSKPFSKDPDGEARFFIDLNRNGDLTDEKFFEFNERGVVDMGDTKLLSYMGEFDVEGAYIDENGDRKIYESAIMIGKLEGSTDVLLSSKSRWVGNLELNGKEYYVALTDMVTPVVPKDLQSDNKYRQRIGFFYIDRDNDLNCLIAGMKPGEREVLEPTEPFVIDGTTFELKVDKYHTNIAIVSSDKVVSGPAPKTELLAVGADAPDFSLKTLEGKTVHLSDYKGQVVILDFWATWCTACKATFPEEQEIFETVKTQGATVLAVCTSDTEEKFKGWLNDRRLGLYSFTWAIDEGNTVGDMYNVHFLPTKYIINREGKIVAAWHGGGNKFSDQLKSALKDAGLALP